MSNFVHVYVFICNFTVICQSLYVYTKVCHFLLQNLSFPMFWFCFALFSVKVSKFFSYFLDAFISMFLIFSAYDHLKMLFYIFFVKKKYHFFLCNNSYFLLLFVLFWKKSYKCKNYFMASVFQFSGCCLSSLLLFFEIL